MSFSFNFVVQTKEKALEMLDRQNAPLSVHDFVADAISGLVTARGPQSEPYLISVKADGHLCTGAGSYEQSTATIAVTSIRLTL